MKTHHQNTWAFAKLALVVLGVVGVVACGVGGGDEGPEDHSRANITPVANDWNFDVEVKASSATLNPNQTFTLTAVTQNNRYANIATPAITLTYYLSSDSTLDASATPVGTNSVPPILPSGESSQSFSLTAPSDKGFYYYIACAPEDGAESFKWDNCGRVEVAVDDTIVGFDLSVTTFSVSDSSVVTRGKITFNLTVRNHLFSTETSPSTIARYYRSSDASITSSDTEVKTRYVGMLTPSATSNVTASVSVPSSPGIYYYGACVGDAADGDADASNDCSAGVEVEASSLGFDLSVIDFSVGAAIVDTSDTITLTATVGNALSATESSPGTTVNYYLSSDATITSDDLEIASRYVEGLARSATSVSSTNTHAPTAVGDYYYGACVDEDGDGDPSNDCSAGKLVNVNAVGYDKWDFETMFSIDDSIVTPSQTITLSGSVGNAARAGIASPAFALTYYLSSDRVIDDSDTPVGTDSVPSLEPGEESSQSISLAAPSVKSYYHYIACAPGGGAERESRNNCDVVGMTVNSSGERESDDCDRVLIFFCF